MRVIDRIAQDEVRVVQVYLSVDDARCLVEQLGKLLGDAEAIDHFHVGHDADRDASFSIVTPSKLAADRYTALESRVLADMPCA